VNWLRRTKRLTMRAALLIACSQPRLFGPLTAWRHQERGVVYCRDARKLQMARFAVEDKDRSHIGLLPECADNFVAEDHPVRYSGSSVNWTYSPGDLMAWRQRRRGGPRITGQCC
jgi:hypothetical protein